MTLKTSSKIDTDLLKTRKKFLCSSHRAERCTETLSNRFISGKIDRVPLTETVTLLTVREELNLSTSFI